MSLFVKICGIAVERDAMAVAGMAPDALGFVFWPDSKRFVEPAVVGEWHLPGDVKRVGVFVDATPEDVKTIVQEARLDVVQLHGDEDPRQYAALGVQVWKALHLAESNVDSGSLPTVDAFLVDSRNANMPGGTGRVCDWDAAAEFAEQSDRNVILAGGLNPANVAEGVARVKPWGVDVSTGVEDGPGRKNLDLVREFIEICRKM